MENSNKKKLNYPQIFLIGFGFLASSLAWAIYNAQVPLILENRFLLSGTSIGTIMTIDNFFGIIFQPVIGSVSDNTHTRLGRRLPWILIGLPICALLFLFIPLQDVLFTFMFVIILFNLIMSLWRSPVISLMPDVTPPALRSEANGIINLMGGLGSVIALLFGGMLSDMRDDKFYAFLLGTIVMVIALFILLKYIREPDAIRYHRQNNIAIKNNTANRWAKKSLDYIENNQPAIEAAEKKENTRQKQGRFQAFTDLPKDEKKSLISMLFAIFFWFLGYNAIETFFTIYATNTYDITGGQASMMLAGFSLTFLLFAIPAGRLAQKFGRKRTIILGLVALILLFIPTLLQPSPWMLLLLLVVAGAFWSNVNINSLPIVLQFSNDNTIGAFTGYYYLFSFAAAIVSPILYGFIQDSFQSESLLFAYAIVCFIIALIAMFFVNHGEDDGQ